jgi:hypothetical protein
MSNCIKIKRLLSRFLDKETSPAEAKQVEEHLAVCPACQQEFLELSGIKRLVGSRAIRVLPQDYLILRLRQELAQEQGAEAGFSFDLIGNLCRRFIPVPVCAVVLSILLLIVSAGRQSTLSLGDQILNGNTVTTEMALNLMIGAKI